MDVLLVEDDVDCKFLIEKILSSQGYQIVSFDTGEAVLDYCKKTVVKLVLTDISLPGMDGVSLAEQLRALPEYKNVPIVMLSAHSMEEMQERAKGAGCTEFLSKPIAPDALLGVASKYIQSKGG